MNTIKPINNEMENRLAEFQAAIEKLVEDATALVETALADCGNTSEYSQKIAFLNHVRELDHLAQGSTTEDLKASPQEMAQQLSAFCSTNDLPQLSADELLCGSGINGYKLTTSQYDWLENFCRKWEHHPET